MVLNWVTIRFYGTWMRDADGDYYSRRSRNPAFYCNETTADIVEATIANVCDEHDWRNFDCVAMDSHIHWAFGANERLERRFVLGRIKSRITRTLRAQSLLRANERMWSKDNSYYRYLPMSELPRVLAYCAKNRRERWHLRATEHG